jgi:hypothetical protein
LRRRGPAEENGDRRARARAPADARYGQLIRGVQTTMGLVATWRASCRAHP